MLDFYRERAPDLQIHPSDVSAELVQTVPVLWIPATRLSQEPSRSTTKKILRWRKQRSHTILDLDWRPSLWERPEHARTSIEPVLEEVTITVGNQDECLAFVGSADPSTAADRLLEYGLDTAIIKLGARGVLVATQDGLREYIAPLEVEVTCGLGAGDAFGGALCHGILSGWDFPKSVHFANAAGAIVASRLMCADAMPTSREVEQIMGLVQ